MPLNPPEDEDDTVVNIIYPLEPPVRFLISYLKGRELLLVVSVSACYVLWRVIITKWINQEIVTSTSHQIWISFIVILCFRCFPTLKQFNYYCLVTVITIHLAIRPCLWHDHHSWGHVFFVGILPCRRCYLPIYGLMCSWEPPPPPSLSLSSFHCWYLITCELLVLLFLLECFAIGSCSLSLLDSAKPKWMGGLFGSWWFEATLKSAQPAFHFVVILFQT